MDGIQTLHYILSIELKNGMYNQIKDHIATYEDVMNMSQEIIDKLFPLTHQFGPKIVFEHFIYLFQQLHKKPELESMEDSESADSTPSSDSLEVDFDNMNI